MPFKMIMTFQTKAKITILTTNNAETAVNVILRSLFFKISPPFIYYIILLFAFQFFATDMSLFCESSNRTWEKHLFCTLKPTTEILPTKTEKTLIKSEFFCGYIFFVALWWCGRRDLNPHAWALAPKTSVSAIPPRPRDDCTPQYITVVAKMQPNLFVLFGDFLRRVWNRCNRSNPDDRDRSPRIAE